MPDEPCILLIEDEPDFAVELVEFLAGHGMRVHWHSTLDDMFPAITELRPDLLLLDQFIGRQDALTRLPELRRVFGGGIVVLTGNQDAVDRVVALETGADDFVAKAQPPRELLARIRAVLRRARPDPEPAATPSTGADGRLAVSGGWQIDIAREFVRAPDGTVLRLTHTDFQALLFLARNTGRLVSRDELSSAVLGRPFRPLDRSVDVMVSRVRKMLELYMNGIDPIRSVRGKGYLFSGFDTSNIPAIMPDAEADRG